MSAVALRLAGAAAGLLASVLLAGGGAELATALDFNAAPLEDWLGPFRSQGAALLAGEHEPVPGFLYPPSAAVLFMPLGSLGPDAAAALGWLVQVCSLALVAALAPRLAGPGWSSRWDLPFGLAAGLCVPVLHSLHWGQMGAPLAALVLLWLLAAPSPRAVGALGDLGLAVAVALKGYPLLAALPVYAAGWSPRRFLLAAALVGVVLPALVLGADLLPFTQAVASRLAALSTEGGAWWGSANRQSLAAAVGRAVGQPGPPLALTASSLVAFAALAGLALRAARGGARWGGASAPSDAVVAARVPSGRASADPASAPSGGAPPDEAQRRAVAAGLLLLAGLVLLPGPAWPHHLAALPLLWAAALPKEGAARACVVASAIVASAPLLLALGGWERAYALGLPLLAHLLAGLAVALSLRDSSPRS